jgi:hypothetical protein
MFATQDAWLSLAPSWLYGFGLVGVLRFLLCAHRPLACPPRYKGPKLFKAIFLTFISNKVTILYWWVVNACPVPPGVGAPTRWHCIVVSVWLTTVLLSVCASRLYCCQCVPHDCIAVSV